jgi:glycosyltransferase involved in cell wall biosynthesis
MKVTIVIPAYNEEGAIGPVVDALKSLPLESEILVVDDGSKDKTAEIAHAHGARVIRHPANRGYGRSVKDAIRVAQNDVISAMQTARIRLIRSRSS